MGKDNDRGFKVITAFIKPGFRLRFSPTIIGAENIPKDGAVVIAGNHKNISDQFLVFLATKRVVNYMAKREYFDGALAPLFRWAGCIPVNRDGFDAAAVRSAIKILKKGGAVGIFPEGTRSKTGHMLPLLGGASLLALKSGCDVVPVYIEGNYKPFRRMKVHVGKPIVMDDLRAGRMNKETCDELTRRMEAEFAQLSGGRSLPPAQ